MVNALPVELMVQSCVKEISKHCLLGFRFKFGKCVTSKCALIDQKSSKKLISFCCARQIFLLNFFFSDLTDLERKKSASNFFKKTRHIDVYFYMSWFDSCQFCFRQISYDIFWIENGAKMIISWKSAICKVKVICSMALERFWLY